MPLSLPLHLVRLAEQAPDPEDVTAGWMGALVFVLLIGAVVFLGFSLVKQLRKAQAAKDAGVYGDGPVSADSDAETGDLPPTTG